MMRYVYAFKDKVAGYAIDTQVNDMEPDKAKIVFQRQLLMQPAPVFRDVEVYHIGYLDDEELILKPCPKQFVCNFDEVFSKLDLIAEKKKIIEDAKKEAAAITKAAQEGAKNA